MDEFIRFKREWVFDFAKHFLFGLPLEAAEKHGADIMRLRDVDDTGTWTEVIIENKDIFAAREWILSHAKDFDTLNEFSVWWENHLAMLDGCKK